MPMKVCSILSWWKSAKTVSKNNQNTLKKYLKKGRKIFFERI